MLRHFESCLFWRVYAIFSTSIKIYRPRSNLDANSVSVTYTVYSIRNLMDSQALKPKFSMWLGYIIYTDTGCPKTRLFTLIQGVPKLGYLHWYRVSQNTIKRTVGIILSDPPFKNFRIQHFAHIKTRRYIHITDIR